MSADAPEPRVIGIVVAGGAGRRFGGAPKQFRRLAGRPLVEWAARALIGGRGVAGVVLVLPRAQAVGPEGERLRRLGGVLSVVPGGATRAESVRCGLAVAAGADIVLVHDAARPLTAPETVDAVIEATIRVGAAVPTVPVTDTLKRVDAQDRIVETVVRDALHRAQTPQGARTAWLREALERAGDAGREVTDEASALEACGRPVARVPGREDNIKITTAEDLERVERLTGAGDDLRVGQGFDVHRFGGPGPLRLGGVVFDDEPGLEGHSDADVVLHAVMDALLGAAGDGDIGVHFPPSDPRWGGADSRDLTRRVAARLASAGWSVVNLDVTLLAQHPRLGERRMAVRDGIAACLDLPAERVGLKATTLEGLGALGRAEGIACQAVALIHRGRAG